MRTVDRVLAVAVLLAWTWPFGGCGTKVERLPGATSEMVLRIHTPPYQDAFDGVASFRVRLLMPNDGDLSTQIDVRTSEFSLAGPPAENVILVLEGLGLDGQTVISSGRSAPFDLDPEISAVVDLLFARKGEFARLLGDLGHPRFGHTASPLADGRILVFGGAMSGNREDPEAFAPPEVYDLRTQSSCVFSGVPCPTYPGADRRFGHSATSTPQGKVFVFGGEDETGALVQPILLFDPAMDGLREFVNYDPAQILPRRDHAATAFRFADGSDQGLRDSVMVTGGEIDSGDQRVPTPNVLLFDTQAETFTHTDKTLVHPRQNHTATTVGPEQDLVLVAGGEAGVGLVDAGELFDGTSFRVVEPSGVYARNGLLSPRVNHAAVSMPGGVMILGGDNKVASMDAPEMFLLQGELGSGFFALNITATHAGHEQRRGAVSAWLPTGEVLLAGGERLDGFDRDLLDTAEVLQAEESSLDASFYGVAPIGRYLAFSAMAVLDGGPVMFLGGITRGVDGPEPSGEVFLYNP
jgi:hypothetical protein